MSKKIFSGPFLIFILCGTLIPLCMIAYYGITDRNGSFTLDNIMAKSEEIDHQLNRISTQIEEKEKQVAFITRNLENLEYEDDFTKEKEPVSVMTTMIENEDEFIKENKQVKVKTKK